MRFQKTLGLNDFCFSGDEGDYPLGYLGRQVPLAGVAHQVGTCRMGTDPESSVLDTRCKAHDLDNLYVVDGSFFPSGSGVNPGLTIKANTLRVCDHPRDRLGA